MTQVVHVSALEGVVAAPFLRPVVEQAGVGQLGVEDRKSALISSSSVQRTPYRIEPTTACPPMTMPMSRGKKRLGSGGKANPSSLSAGRDGPALLAVPSISISRFCAGEHGAELLGEGIRGHDVHGLADEEIARLGLRRISASSSRTW